MAIALASVPFVGRIVRHKLCVGLAIFIIVFGTEDKPGFEEMLSGTRGVRVSCYHDWTPEGPLECSCLGMASLS